MERSRSWMIVAASLSQIVFLALAVVAWGDWRGFFAHPVRVALVGVSTVLTLGALSAGASFSRGRRDDVRDRWIFLPFILGGVLLVWLPPYLDSRDIMTLDGDAVRYAGLVVFTIGGVLRVGPIFTLGNRFSAFVAIQEGHELVTDGWYGVIRHPSYLGALLIFLGWILTFRCGPALLLMPFAVWAVIARIHHEEALLASEFGDTYAAYRRRTWRLVPRLY